jgi:arginyl-tRNA synthetase
LPVLKAEPAIKAVRLELIKAVKQVLVSSINLLGLPILEEM